MESNKNVNFLDLSIARKHTCIGISIFRKPITTDTTIKFLSNRPLEHKMATYRFLRRRILSLPLDKEQQYKNSNTITRCTQQRNLNSPTKPIKTQNTAEQILAEIPHPHTLQKGTKWYTFTYSSPQIRKITIFKHTNIRIAYKCSNTISHPSKPANKPNLPPKTYGSCGIYALAYMTCKKAYVGQTSRA